MALSNNLALGRETAMFITKEATWGVLVFPTAAAAVAALDVPVASQKEAFSDSDELADSRSLQERFRDRTPPGEFSFALYPRPSGVAGTGPLESVLLECGFGKKTVNAGTSVVYEPIKTALPSFSLCYKEGHTCHFASGCTVGKTVLSWQGKGACKLEFSGPFKKVVRAGTEETITGSTTTVIKLTAGGAKLFDVDARVMVGANDNSGSGYTITATDEAGDSITVTPALATAPAAGVVVQGFLPTVTLSGAPALGRTAAITLDGTPLAFISGSITLDNGVAPDEETYTDDGFCASPLFDLRRVTGSIQARFLRTHARFYNLARQQGRSNLIITIGDTTGKKLKWEAPRAEWESPEASGDRTKRDLALNFVAMPSSALEDEATLTYF